jgi:Skp family chaperone for outer membrane proteins
MKRVCLVVAFAVGLVAARALGEGEERKARPLLVGTVDIGVVFQKYKRKDDLEKEINTLREGFEKEAAKQNADLEAMQKKLPQDRKSPEFRQQSLEIQQAMAKIRFERDQWDSKLKAEIERITGLVLDEIENEIKEFGKKNGFDLIFKTDNVGWGDERFQERVFRSQVESLVYHKDSLDVTTAIVDELNAKKR